MGQAFHRKQIGVSRAHTKGTGIHYVERRVSKSNADALAEKEQMLSTRGLREWNRHVLMMRGGFALDAWEDSILAKKGMEEDPALVRLVDRAYKSVDTAVSKHCDSAGINIDGLIGSLRRRNHGRNHEEMKAALEWVAKDFEVFFAAVTTEKAA